MANAAPKLGPFEHIVEADKDAPEKTVFKLRPLGAFEYMQAGEIINTRSRAECFEFVLKTALLGWSHFVDGDGMEVKFSRKQTENLERLTLRQVVELANRILEASVLDENERKN